MLVYCASRLPFAVKHENYVWLNAGVIGIPANDGTSCVWFMTISESDNEVKFQFHHFDYDHETTSRLMIENGLPAAYATTLKTGIWDNCEILPVEETNKQGQEIVL